VYGKHVSDLPPDDGRAIPRGLVRPRTIVIGLAVGIPLSLLFLWLAVRGVRFSEVWDVMAGANVALVIVSIPLLCSIFFFQGRRWRALLGKDANLPVSDYVGLTVLGNGVSCVVPGRPGDLVRAVWFSRLARLPVSRGLASVGVDRAFDVITLVVILLVCLPFVGHPPWLRTLAIIAGIIAVALLVILVLAWWYSHRSSQGQAWIESSADAGWIKRQAAGLVRGMATMNSLAQVAAVIAWSFAGWLAWTLGAWVLAFAIGVPLTVGGALFLCGVFGLGAAIPSAPGQIGTTQWLAVVGFAVLGVGKADALAFSVLLQLDTIVPTVLASPGAAWWLARRTPRRSRGAVHGPAAQ